MEYRDRTFRGESVRVDGNTFTGCRFEDVVFEFGGGPTGFVDCVFDSRIHWHLDGPLRQGLDTLRQFHHAAGPKGVKALVDGIAAMLRRKDRPESFTIG